MKAMAYYPKIFQLERLQCHNGTLHRHSKPPNAGRPTLCHRKCTIFWGLATSTTVLAKVNGAAKNSTF